MRFLFAFSLFTLAASPICAQTQLLNAGFEEWENTGTALEEPKHWNGLMSGDLCMLCSFGSSQRVFQDAAQKVEGMYSVRIESKSIIGGLIVNGTVTTGRVVARSANPSLGFNMSIPANKKFNQEFSAVPDSLVFWAKYSITDRSDSALVSFFIHGSEQLKDPDHRKEGEKVVTMVQQKFQTLGKWQRVALKLETVHQYISPQYVLATFSSSWEAGKGNGDAVLWVDDVQFIYNDQLSDASP